MAQSQQSDAEKQTEEAAQKAEAPASAPVQQTPVIAQERIPVGQNVVSDRTEETADQLARGVSPVSDDATADAERAVADEPASAARDRRGTTTDSSIHQRLDVLEADMAKLRAQLRHML